MLLSTRLYYLKIFDFARRKKALYIIGMIRIMHFQNGFFITKIRKNIMLMGIFKRKLTVPD